MLGRCGCRRPGTAASVGMNSVLIKNCDERTSTCWGIYNMSIRIPSSAFDSWIIGIFSKSETSISIWNSRTSLCSKFWFTMHYCRKREKRQGAYHDSRNTSRGFTNEGWEFKLRCTNLTDMTLTDEFCGKFSQEEPYAYALSAADDMHTIHCHNRCTSQTHAHWLSLKF